MNIPLSRWVLGFSLLSLSAFSDAREMTLMETVTTKSVASMALSAKQQVAFAEYAPRNPYTEADGGAHLSLHLRDLIQVDAAARTYLGTDTNFSQVSFDAAGDYLYFLSKRGDDKTRGLYRIALAGGEAQPVFHHHTDILQYSLSASGDKLAFSARAKAPASADTLQKHGFKAEVFEEQHNFTHLFLVDLSNPTPTAAQLTEDAHILSVAWRPQHEQILVRAAPTPLIDDNYMASSYQLRDLTGALVHTFDSVGKLGKAEFSPAGRYLAVIGAASYNDPADGRLYVYDSRADFSKREVLPDYQGHVQDLSWRGNEELIWLGHRGTESEIQAITMQWLETRVLLEPGIAIATAIDATPGVEAIAVRANTAAHPNELFKLERGQLQRLTDSNPWLAELTMPTQETIRYKARDGLELEGILVYPTNYQAGERYPLIMVVHGGPEAHYSNGWLDRYASPAKHAAANGYMLFFPNYRGSTGRGVEFSQLGQNDYAGKEFDDLVDAKQHLVDQGLVDAERAGITGGSYGGFASAWGATAQTEHWAASVMFVGISNNLSKFGTTDIAKEMHAVHARSYPWEKWQWYLERSPIFHAPKSRTPTLILHGKEDTRVHPSQSMELYRYLKTLGQTPVRLVLYPGEGHGNRRAAAQLDYAQRLMRWMDSFLVEGATAAPAHELPHAAAIEATE